MDNNAYLVNLLSMLDTQLYAMVTEIGDGESGPIYSLLNRQPGFRSAADTDEDPDEHIVQDLRETVLDTLKSLTAAPNRSGFDRICSVFDLNEAESLMFLACLAVSVDPRYEQIYAYLQNGKIYPTVDTLLRLALPDGPDRLRFLPLLQENGRLLGSCLLERIPNDQGGDLSVCYRSAPGMIEAVSGTHREEIYHGRTRWISSPKVHYEDLLAEFVPNADPDQLLMISWHGPDLQMQRFAAENYASAHQKQLLILDMKSLQPSEELFRLLRFALRDAAIHNALLLIEGLDEKVDTAGILDGEIGNVIGESRTTVLFSSKSRFIFSPEVFSANRLLLNIPISGMTGLQRRSIWMTELGDAGISDEDIRDVAGQFVLSGSQIKSAARSARAEAIRCGRDLTRSDLFAGARAAAMHHLSELAKKIPPKYNASDLILPEAQQIQMNELIAMAKNRPLVLEEWGLGKKLTSGYGISALFTGPPGTGKTLSAQVIAGELQLDMYRIDLSTVVSKYIGETEKNLEKIFSEAQNSNVILFFDEADSLFGKRSDVGDSHDRYANIEVGYLLQRMENYDGLVILATNLGANLDEAFTRRIHFIIDFPFPDDATRLTLWSHLLPENVAKADDIDLDSLAKTYRIAGGNIRNAIVSAVYFSAESNHPLCQADLIHGIEREYQKMGRVFK